MSSYTVGEEGENLEVCVVILPGPTFADNVINLNAVIDVATTGDTATGIKKININTSNYLTCPCSCMYSKPTQILHLHITIQS